MFRIICRRAFGEWFAAQGPLSDGVAARRLLLVDDSQFFRNMLAPLLKASGYQVTAVGVGARRPWR